MANSTVGYIGIAFAVLFFGSNFIPIKKFETGDGMMFQFVVCTGMNIAILFNLGIWFTGLLTAIIRQCKLWEESSGRLETCAPCRLSSASVGEWKGDDG